MELTAADIKAFGAHVIPRGRPSAAPNYAYTCARVKARRASLLPRETYERLMVMDLPDIIRAIGESSYRTEVAELGLRHKGLGLLENALLLNFAGNCRQILGFCKGELSHMVGNYLNRYHVGNIKTVIRGKHYRASEAEISSTIIPAGPYDMAFWLSLIKNAQTVDEAVEGLKSSPYYPLLLKITKPGQKALDLFELENAIDMEYYRILLDGISPDSKANKMFLQYIKNEIDLVNLRTLLMASFRAVDPTVTKNMLIHGGNIPHTELNALAANLDFGAVIAEASKYRAMESARDKVPEATGSGSLSHVIMAMEVQHIHETERFSRLYPLSILPVINFIMRKKIEVDNIRIIARGKESGLPAERIRQMLVV